MLSISLALGLGATVLATLAPPPVVAAVRAIPDQALVVGQPFDLDVAGDFVNAERFALAPSSALLPQGLRLEGSVISGAPSAPMALATLIVRGSNATSHADSAFQVSVAMPDVAPTPDATGEGPRLSGAPRIGAAVSALPGDWLGAARVETRLLVGGVERPSPYVLQPGDDRAAVVVRDTAYSPGGLLSHAESAAQTALWSAPVVTGTPDPVTAAVGDAPVLRDLGALVSGDAGGLWSVTGPGASIDQTGVVTISADAAALGTVVATFVNSGGRATLSFLATVAASGASGPWSPAEIPDALLFRADPAALTLSGDDVVAWTAEINTFAAGGAATLSSFTTGRPAWNATRRSLEWTNTDNVVRGLRGAVPGVYDLNETDAFTVVVAMRTNTFDHAGTAVGFGRRSDALWRYGFSSANLLHNGAVTGGTEPRVTIRQVGAYIYGGELYRLPEGLRRQGWINGRLVQAETTAQPASPAGIISVGGLPDSQTPGAFAAFRAADIAAVFICRGRLSSEDRQRLEGWLKHNVALVSGVDLSDADGVAEHPWDATAPFVGGAPVLVNALPTLTVYSGVRIEPVDLDQHFVAADLYSVENAPEGLTVVNRALVGATTTTGDHQVTLRAMSSGGEISVTAPLRIQPAPTAARSALDVIAIATAAAPGATVTLDGDALAGTTGRARRLGAMAGPVEATLVGYVDFVGLGQAALDAGVDPALPAGLSYAGHEPIAFTDRRLQAVAGAPAPAHPVYASAWTNSRGPASGLPVPLDFRARAGGVEPMGLRVNSETGAESWRNGLRFEGLGDGHVVWVAEYLDAAGQIVRHWTESLSRASDLPFWPDASTADGSAPRALWLRRLVALRVAPMAALAAPGVGGAADPRLWNADLTPKLERHALTIHHDLRATPAANAWAAVEAHVAGLTVNADGRIVVGGTPLPDGAPYVVALPEGLIRRNATDVQVRIDQFVGGAMAAKLAAATRNRVMLAGVAGRTFMPGLWLGASSSGAPLNLDLAWIAFRREGVLAGTGGELPADSNRGFTAAYLRLQDRAHLRAFGCWFMGQDGQTVAPVGLAGAWAEVYDSLIDGFYSAAVIKSGAGYNPEAASRLLISRSLIDVANDMVEGYGPAHVQVSRSYSYGTGGQYNITGWTWLHRDYLGQFFVQREGGVFSYAFYDNIAMFGPNHHDMAASRSYSEQMVIQQGRFIFDVVGNALEIDGPTTGLGQLSAFAPPPSGTPRLAVTANHLLAHPTLTGTRTAGQTVAAVPGQWDGAAGVTTRLLLSGVEVASPYLIRTGDDVNGFVVRDEATGPTGLTAWAERRYGAAVTTAQSEPLGWVDRGVFADNLFFGRADRMLKADYWPEAHRGQTLGGGQGFQDTTLFANNVIDADHDARVLALFDRSTAFIPEARRAGWPDTRDLTGFPAIVQTGTVAGLDAAATLDWSGTAYAGTGREGWLAPRDLTPSATLARYRGTGKGWSPEGLPELSADWRAHVGWVDAGGAPLAGSGMPGDAFARWAPTAFAPNATIADPWNGGGEDDKLFLNLRVATRGVGTIAEEIAANGAGWRLELQADHRPRWTMFGAGGAPVLARLGDATPVQDGDRLMVAVNTAWRTVAVEPVEAGAAAARAVRTGAGPLRARVTVGNTAPTPDVTGQRHVWIDEDGERLHHEWTGTAWRPLAGWLADYIAVWQRAVFRQMNQPNPPAGNYDGCDLPDGDYTIRFVVRRADVATAGLTPSDYVFAVYNDGVTENPQNATSRWTGAAWEAQTLFQITQRPRGMIDGFFRVDGGPSRPSLDWDWPNTRILAAGAAGFSTVDIPKGTLRVGAAASGAAPGLTLNYFEARRQRVSTAVTDANTPADATPGISTPITVTERLFGAPPLDPATGARDTMFGPAPVWLTAP